MSLPKAEGGAFRVRDPLPLAKPSEIMNKGAYGAFESATNHNHNGPLFAGAVSAFTSAWVMGLGVHCMEDDPDEKGRWKGHWCT